MLLSGVLDLLPGLEAAESGLDFGGGFLLETLLLPHQVAADAGLDLGCAAVLYCVVLVLVLLVHGWVLELMMVAAAAAVDAAGVRLRSGLGPVWCLVWSDA